MKRAISLLLSLVLIFSMAIGTPIAAAAANTLTYTASFNPIEITTSDADQSVTVVISSTSSFSASSIGANITLPNGWTLTGLKNDTVGSTDAHRNLSTGILTWGDPASNNHDNVTEVLTATFTVPGGTAAGDYDIQITGIAIAKDYSFTEVENSGSYTATLTIDEPESEPDPPVSEETSDYEIYYTLDSTTDNVTPNYKDYEISPDANTETEVIATIKLKNNTATALTLQAYDIYLDYHAGLKYKSHAMTGAVALADGSSTNAAAGAAVTHIEAVSDTYKNSAANKTLPANGELELGTISFTIDTNNTDVKYATPLNIGFDLATDATNSANVTGITNFSVGSTTGDKKSYYPMLTGDTLGAEVVNTYAVTYNANGGNGGITSATKQYNIPLALEFTNIPSREGYTFLGWDESGTATTATYTSTGTSSYTDNEGTTLYAVWKQNNVTVTFNMNGHGENTTESVVPGNTVTKPTDPTATGYTFGGWYTDASCTAGNEFSFDTPVTEAKTLYAKWSINQYTITFANTGDSTIPAITQNYNTAVTAPADPTKTGYTFAGWDKTIPTEMPAKNMTITAKWTVNQYTIKFNTDGGTDVPSITQDYGSSVTAPTAPTKTGYKFDGWDNLPATMPVTPEGGLTVTAKWTPITYQIVFDGNNATSGEMSAQTFTYDASNKLNKNQFDRDDYVFVGWTKTKGGTVVDYSDEQTITDNLATGEGTTVTLYAVWKQDVYKIKYTHDPVDVEVTSTLEGAYSSETGLTIADPTAKGYTFAGWTSDALNITTAQKNVSIPKETTGEVDLKAHWTINQYTITFNTDGGSTVEAITKDYGASITEPDDPTKEGYTFTGWSEKIPATMPAENKTITAKWKINQYTITFDGGDGAENMPENITQDYNTTVTAPTETPTKTGYTFAGWDVDGDGTYDETSDKFYETMPHTDAENKTITVNAVWTEHTYGITYDRTEGIKYDAAVEDKTGVTYTEKVTLPGANLVTKTGYTLTGWTVTEDGVEGSKTHTPGEEVSGLTSTNNGSVKLTPVWTPITYSIEFNSNGGTGEMEGITGVNYDADVTLTANEFTKIGYTFSGWAKDDKATVKEYSDGETVKNLTTTDRSTVILYAVWTPTPYTITLNPNGGTITADDWTKTEDGKYTKSYDITQTVALPIAENGLYTLNGWIPDKAVGNWTTTLHNANTEYSGRYGSVELTADWGIPFTYAIEEYKYAYTDYVMLRIATTANTNPYSFEGKQMYYTDDANYKLEVTTKNEDGTETKANQSVFVTLIPKTGNVPTDENGNITKYELTSAGMKLLTKSTANDSASIIDRDGDVNDDGVVNIADANVVYQMAECNGGSYYGMDQLLIKDRLEADMDTAEDINTDDHRGSIADVNVVVNHINGVVETTNP